MTPKKSHVRELHNAILVTRYFSKITRIDVCVGTYRTGMVRVLIRLCKSMNESRGTADRDLRFPAPSSLRCKSVMRERIARKSQLNDLIMDYSDYEGVNEDSYVTSHRIVADDSVEVSSN